MNGTMRPVKLLIKEAEAEKAAPQANTNKQAAA